MTDHQHVQKSLTDEILDEMFTTLEEQREEFDRATIDGLPLTTVVFLPRNLL